MVMPPPKGCIGLSLLTGTELLLVGGLTILLLVVGTVILVLPTMSTQDERHCAPNQEGSDTAIPEPQHALKPQCRNTHEVRGMGSNRQTLD